jgi:hypothetical protein
VEISTDIPKGNLFLFENYWMEHEHFFSGGYAWLVPTYFSQRCSKNSDGQIQESQEGSKGLAKTYFQSICQHREC